MNSTSLQNVKLDKDLKPLAKKFYIKNLRNKDKNTYIKALSIYLVDNGLVEVNLSTNAISRDDVKVNIIIREWNCRWLVMCYKNSRKWIGSLNLKSKVPRVTNVYNVNKLFVTKNERLWTWLEGPVFLTSMFICCAIKTIQISCLEKSSRSLAVIPIFDAN